MRFFCVSVFSVTTMLTGACGTESAPTTEEAAPAEYTDLGLGEVNDYKDDGNWGSATTCKAIPSLTPLKDPAIVVSLDGLTLRAPVLPASAGRAMINDLERAAGRAGPGEA